MPTAGLQDLTEPERDVLTCLGMRLMPEVLGKLDADAGNRTGPVAGGEPRADRTFG